MGVEMFSCPWRLRLCRLGTLWFRMFVDNGIKSQEEVLVVDMGVRRIYAGNLLSNNPRKTTQDKPVPLHRRQ